jgi:hypothetical protein
MSDRSLEGLKDTVVFSGSGVSVAELRAHREKIKKLELSDGDRMFRSIENAVRFGVLDVFTDGREVDAISDSGRSRMERHVLSNGLTRPVGEEYARHVKLLDRGRLFYNRPLFGASYDESGDLVALVRGRRRGNLAKWVRSSLLRGAEFVEEEGGEGDDDDEVYPDVVQHHLLDEEGEIPSVRIPVVALREVGSDEMEELGSEDEDEDGDDVDEEVIFGVDRQEGESRPAYWIRRMKERGLWF